MAENESYEIDVLNGRKFLDIRYSAFDDTYEFAFEGAEVRRGIGAHAFSVNYGSNSLLVSSPNLLKSPDVQSLFHKTSVKGIVVSAAHVLEVTLSNGTILSFPPHKDFEGWTLSWQGDHFWSAPIGGTLQKVGKQP